MKKTVRSLAFLIALHATALVAAHTVEDPPADLSDAGRVAYHQLLAAKLFSIGGIGYAGVISPYEKAMRILLKEKSAGEACRRLLTEAKPVGRLYALWGLRVTNHEIFRAEARKYRQSPDSVGTVKTMSGCIERDRPIRDVIGDIEVGHY